jgi:hypothetical protein
MLCAWLLTPALRANAQSTDQRLGDVEKKLDAALAEIERMKLGGAAPDTARVPASRYGFAPGASRVYGVSGGSSIGGYGEMLFESPDKEREDGALTYGTSVVDLLRAVFYVGHKFSPTLLFNSEIEFEHAGIGDEAEVQVDPLTGQGGAELSGEVVMEFAYLDWQARPWLGVRAGKLLVPMGLVNEQHEPPVFLGARRPDSERLIVPSTWSAAGAGFFGTTEVGLDWRAYIVEGLDANHFSASSAVRGGRQGGSQALFTHPAFTGRVDWKGTPGFTLGVSGFTGDAWQGSPLQSSLKVRTSLFDIHGDYRWRALQLRGLWASGAIDQAGDLSDMLGLTGSDRLGERFSGGYGEALYDVASVLRPGSEWSVSPYMRWETYDTQDSVPGGSEDPANETEVMTFGVAVKPHPSVVLKADREFRSNQANTETSRWNVALGWLF